MTFVVIYICKINETCFKSLKSTALFTKCLPVCTELSTTNIVVLSTISSD